MTKSFKKKERPDYYNIMMLNLKAYVDAKVKEALEENIMEKDNWNFEFYIEENKNRKTWPYIYPYMRVYFRGKEELEIKIPLLNVINEEKASHFDSVDDPKPDDPSGQLNRDLWRFLREWLKNKRKSDLDQRQC